jgi:hypothetical protein
MKTATNNKKASTTPKKNSATPKKATPKKNQSFSEPQVFTTKSGFEWKTEIPEGPFLQLSTAGSKLLPRRWLLNHL